MPFFGFNLGQTCHPHWRIRKYGGWDILVGWRVPLGTEQRIGKRVALSYRDWGQVYSVGDVPQRVNIGNTGSISLIHDNGSIRIAQTDNKVIAYLVDTVYVRFQVQCQIVSDEFLGEMSLYVLVETIQHHRTSADYRNFRAQTVEDSRELH